MRGHGTTHRLIDQLPHEHLRGGPFPIVSTSLVADGIKGRIQTRSVALGRRSARHHQDL
jgi:hypothetical protein